MERLKLILTLLLFVCAALVECNKVKPASGVVSSELAESADIYPNSQKYVLDSQTEESNCFFTDKGMKYSCKCWNAIDLQTVKLGHTPPAIVTMTRRKSQATPVRY